VVVIINRAVMVTAKFSRVLILIKFTFRTALEVSVGRGAILFLATVREKSGQTCRCLF
jgi:hypothetical protein